MAVPLATLTLMFFRKEVTLQLIQGGEVIESESWSMKPHTNREKAQEISRVAFDDLYDLINYCAHGTDE
jgi:hypothetical protein